MSPPNETKNSSKFMNHCAIFALFSVKAESVLSMTFKTSVFINSIYHLNHEMNGFFFLKLQNLDFYFLSLSMNFMIILFLTCIFCFQHVLLSK